MLNLAATVQFLPLDCNELVINLFH